MNPRISTRRTAALLLAALGLLMLFTVAAPQAAAAPPPTGDWVVTVNESYVNQTIVIEGNVFVRAPAHLNLSNVTLEINSTAAARRGVVVESGAFLRTRDADGLATTPGDRTVIRPLDPLERFTFVAAAGSNVDLQQTNFWGVGYTQSPVNASGVYLSTSAVTLRNVSVFASYFGFVFVGVTGQYTDLESYNNTYNGFDVDATSNFGIAGVNVSDNGVAGVHISGGRANITRAIIDGNDVGLAVKFGGWANVTVFDASGNTNNFEALNNATLRLDTGRITNASASGIDARLASTVVAASISFSDNPTGIYAAGGSTVTVSSSDFVRGARALQLRTAATATFTDVTVSGLNGDAVDLDTSSANFFGCVFDGNAFGGTVVGGTGFLFFDSTLSNSTVGGFTFTNANGVYMHNPTFRTNKGTAVSLAGTTSSLIDATGTATIVGSVVEVRQLAILGTLLVENSTLHAVAPIAWNLSGGFQATNASIIGDVPGASLSLLSGAAVVIIGFTVTDFDLRFDAAAATAYATGLTASGASELAALNGSYNWSSVTQTGTGRVRVASGNLTIAGGSIARVRAENGGRVDLMDVTADLSGATFAGSGLARAWWTTSVATQWQAGVAAASQPYALTDAASATIASGTTNGAGSASLGPVLSQSASLSGIISSNPHRLTGGSGSWISTAFYNITAPGVLVLTLIDIIAPTLSITAPSPGARLNADPVVIAGLAADNESGLFDIEWSYDNSSFSPSNLTIPFGVPVPAPFETVYTIFVRVHDKAGNFAVASVSYRVDRTAPNIVLTAPLNGSTVRGPTVRFVGGTEIGAVLTIGGTPVAVDATGLFDANLTLADGDYSLTVLATDLAGNFATGLLLLHVDSVAPGIAVDAPLNGSTVAAGSATLEGRVEPGASFSVDGAGQVVASNGSFSALVYLDTEGAHSFSLRSVDLAGNVNQTTWTLVRDTRAPAIAVAGLVGSGPFLLNSTRPTFNITVDEFAVITASVTPGGITDSAAGTALTFTPLLSTGTATLTVHATDAAGNARTATFALTVDVTPPTITLDPRVEGGAVNANPWRFVVTTEPGANVTINGVTARPAAPGGTTFGADINLTSGSNTVVITVVDAAGNTAARTVTIVLDVVPPPLELLSPQNGVRTSDRQIVVSGTTEPNATLTVAGVPVTVGASGEWSVVVQLISGSNRIVVVSTDAAGNSATQERTVTRAGTGSSLTGIPFIDQNGWFLLFLLIAVIIAAMLVSSGKARRRALADKSASIERDIDGARAMRNDMSALENFQPRNVNDPHFVSADSFRGDMAGYAKEPPSATSEPVSKKPR